MPQSDHATNEAAAPVLVIGVVAALASLHALLLAWQGLGPVDDDYIVYRYARNWVESGVLAFNVVGSAAPPVEGFTSPLWLCFCAVAEFFSIRPAAWTTVIGALSAGLTTLWAGLAMRAAAPASARLWVLLVPLLLALSPSLAWHSVTGLGTAPMAASIALALLAAVRGRIVLFGLASAIAVGFRLEALLVLLPLGLTVKRGNTLGWVAPALLMAAAITLLRWRLFSEALPNTYFVKRLPLSDEVGYGARYLVRVFSEGGLAAWAFCAIIATRHPLSRGLSVGTILALLFVLSCGGDWMVYGRFLVPFAPCFAVGAGFLLLAVRSSPGRVVVALLLLASTAAGLRPEVRSQALFEHRFFEAWWQRVGLELQDRAPADSSIALSPIGAIGLHSGLPIIDVLGLTHSAFRDVAPDLENVGMKGHHRHSGAWVLDQEPTYLLLGNAVLQPSTGSIDVNPWEADIVADPRFRKEYVAETVWFDEPDGPRRALPYFRRRSAPVLAP